jgi:hypothetical protein
MPRLALPLTPLLRLASLAVAAAATACFTTGSTTDDEGIVDDAGILGLDVTTAYDTGSPRPVGDGGPCLPATSLPPSQVPAYAPVVPDVGACTSAQIDAFLAACIGATSTTAACTAFQIATDAGPATCVPCLVRTADAGPPPNNGGVLLDSTGSFMVGVNTPGCIALADPTHGPACAAALEPLFQCELAACSSADCRVADAGAYEGCLQSTLADAGACQGELQATAACDTEYADGGAAVTTCATAADVLERICGTGI